jgi:hypothetical protein
MVKQTIKKRIKEGADIIQNELEEEKSKPEKYEMRYKHGGPMRTAKKKKRD